MRLHAAIPDRFRRLALSRVTPVAALAGLLLLSESGCSRFDLQPGWARKRLRMEDVSIADVQGPGERNVRNILRTNHETAALQPTSDELAAQFTQLKSADQLYENGRYVEAEAAYKKIADETKTKTGFRRGWFNRHQFDEFDGGPVHEDALFMIAQSQFQQGRLSDAEKSYGQLLKQYPSTRHLDTVSRQMFRIAREWLGFPDEKDQEIVQVAYGEKAPTIEQRRERSSNWVPNVRDKTRPAFDTEGRALSALRVIWLHDAAGPLADDALMMAANYHLKRGDHIAAAQHYRLLQEQFPDSPHFKDSLMLGSHVLLASYNGAGYDPSPLEEAKRLKSMAVQYPDLTPEDRARLQSELDNITEAEVEPLWKVVQFYLAKRQPESVILHCNYLLNKHPNSRYARMAADVKDRLEKGQKVPPGWPDVEESRAADTTYDPDPAPPYNPPQAAPPVDATARSPQDAKPLQEPRRLFDRFLRRVDQPPQLQPVEPGASPEPAETTPAPATPAPVADESAGRVRLQSPVPVRR